MAHTANTPGIKDSLQNLANWSFDKDYNVFIVETGGTDGVSLQRNTAKNLAIKVTVSGDITYVAKAAPGTAQATEKWQVMKVDETTGTIITWADGDANFDNAATDLTALSYS